MVFCDLKMMFIESSSKEDSGSSKISSHSKKYHMLLIISPRLQTLFSRVRGLEDDVSESSSKKDSGSSKISSHSKKYICY